MTRFLLVRHASTAALGRTISGRAPGVQLTGAGGREAEALSLLLSRCEVQAIYTSPLERCIQTAEAISRTCGLPFSVEPALNEVDFGSWTGMGLDDLHANEEWRLFNEFRSTVRIPGGEMIVEVQARVAGFMGRLAAGGSGSTMALVTHADVIRAALCHFLGMPLDHLLRLEVAPASVSAVELEPWGAKVVSLNRRSVECP